GWSSAHHASAHLAGQLIRAGLGEEFAGLRADVSVRGDGLVCIGSITAEAAHRLAVLLARGLCVELDHTLDGIGDASAA
ncbi:MAG: hypothetical protein HY241_00640, partial [Actinobacteria bacterium]|nr:hypothetical protein [Actinomycetota bacterium]